MNHMPRLAVTTDVLTTAGNRMASRNCCADDIKGALHDLGGGAFADEVLVQDLVAGTTEKAQSVFCRGQMIGFHGYRQVAAGVGGGEGGKQKGERPPGRPPLEKGGQGPGLPGGP